MEQQYAYIKNSEVVNLIIFDEPSEELLNQFKIDNDLDSVVLADNKAYVGGTYDGIKFIPQKPFSSWIYNEEINDWQAPMPYPVQFTEDENGEMYQISFVWNEEEQAWFSPGLVE